VRTASTRRERFLPYRYARGGVDLQILRCELDHRQSVDPDRDARVLDLESTWSTARLSLEAVVPASVCAEVVPGAPSPNDVEVLVVIQCPSTLWRRGTPVAVNRFDAPLSFDISLARDDLAGSARIRGYLIRRTQGSRQRGFASVRGTRVADSGEWDLRIDLKREARGDYLDVRYRRFSEDRMIPVRDRKNLYFLQLDVDSPILWLNADHQSICGILDSQGTVGRQARLREALFDQITYAVWTQLFLQAARNYVELEDFAHEWEEPVLDLVLKDAYPEVKSASERRDHLGDDWRDPTQVLRRLDAALQRREGLVTHLEKLIREENSG
jgi:hypothetical protein